MHTSFFSFLSRHGLFFLILIVATLLRFHDISREMILIGDQGRDFFVARAMVREGKIPLLGIPSSIPRFAQGPVYIYFLAIVYWLTGGSVLATGLLSASFGVFAIVAIYLLIGTYSDWKTGTLASLIMTLLPMALLHSRMPYHINPIPLFVVLYLWQLLRLYHHGRWSSFTVGLAFALLFQFELAVFPSIFLIPFVFFMRDSRTISWKMFKDSFQSGSPMQAIRLLANASSRMTRKRELISVLGGLILGLTPQVIYDFTHRFSQLGGFLVWLVYRLLTTLLPFTRNSIVEGNTIPRIAELLRMYLTIFTQNRGNLDHLFWLLLIPLALIVLLSQRKRLLPIEQISAMGFLILAGSYTIHRVASEAYMPILIPFALIILCQALGRVNRSVAFPIVVMIIISLGSSVYRLEENTFFLLAPHESNWTLKRFGPSIQTQRQIVNVLYRMSKEKCVTLESEERKRTFPTSLDHLEYMLAVDPVAHPGPCVRLRLDTPDSAKRYWENPKDIVDLGAYWAQSIDNEKLYARKNTL